MTATKRKPKVGDKAYEVEWCANIPKDEHGDSVSGEAVQAGEAVG